MTGRSPPIIRRADHVGFVVESIEDALRFWIEGLGASLEREGERDGAFLEQVTGARCEGARIAVVDLAGQKIELLEYARPQPPQGPPLAPFDVGSAHLALLVDDLDDALERMTPYGFRPRGTPLAITQGARLGSRLIYASGPDGVTIELIEPPK